MSALRIATRGSLQARTQSEHIAALLRDAHPGLVVELVFVDTTGDRRQDVPLHTIGGQGVFVKEVQSAVLDGRADVAVHSAKDLPSTVTNGLVIAAFGERRDPRDVLVGSTLSNLADGATVATGSVRRRAQLRRLRPDLRFVELRGNIPTRLVVSQTVANNFVLSDIRVGVEPVLATTQALSMAIFVQDSTAPNFRAVVAEVGMDVSVTVTNISGAGARFTSTIVGAYIAPSL